MRRLGNDGKLKIIPDYPEFTWFEGLVNTVTHRDYAHSGDHIRVMMRDDRTEMLSPGKPPNVVTLENTRRTRWARNPTMAGTPTGFGWVHVLSEGMLVHLAGRGRAWPGGRPPRRAGTGGRRWKSA